MYIVAVTKFLVIHLQLFVYTASVTHHSDKPNRAAPLSYNSLHNIQQTYLPCILLNM